VNRLIKNYWIKNIKRIRNARITKKENLRLDMAEKLDNFPNFFFKNFLKKINQEDFITYPSYSEYEGLIKALAKYNRCKSTNIYLDTGSDACIRTLLQLACKRGTNIVGSSPSFPMYSVYAQGFGASSIKVKYNLDRSLPVSKILKNINRKTRLVILANPNSPYGDYKKKNEISKLASALRKKNILLLIDEAYVEFSPGSIQKLIKTYKNLLVSRTFSKAWGAAGCRIGYIIGNKEIIHSLQNIQLTFPLTCVSVKFVMYLLNNKNFVKSHIEKVKKDRNKLCDLLQKNGFDVLRSHTNSIHFHEKKGNNSKVFKILSKYGVAFKKGTNIGTPIKVVGDNRNTWIRISVGPNIHNLSYIKEIIKSGKKIN